MLVGTVEGVALLKLAQADQARVVRELKRAMTAYLEAVEGRR